jgi:uncharacterized protein YyaL (SSP411 family)
MTACQAMTGSGGWPLNVVVTPEGKPIFAATYLPKRTRMGLPGVIDLAMSVKAAWASRRRELVEAAEGMSGFLAREALVDASGELDVSVLDDAARMFALAYDARHGGFGGAPKFPSPHNLLFLLGRWARTGDSQLLRMVEKTLQAMRLGGIFDHVGFGFHRYSTDAGWLVPHFEKTLYDQALAVMAFTAAFQATGNPFHAQAARETIAYVLRDLTSPEGAFYSGEDADSEGEEGKFYLWTRDEVAEAAGPRDAEIVMRVFTVRPEGNFADETRREPPRNILHLEKPLDELAADSGMSASDVSARLDSSRPKMLEWRGRRVRPRLDDKVLADWNGLMIAALARAGRALDDAGYVAAAQRAAQFVLANMRRTDGGLFHRWRDGEAAIDGFADDYAFLVWGLIELYQAGFDVSHLEEALALDGSLRRRFQDRERGGLFVTADDAERLIVREKHWHDGATPSANSAAAMNMVLLGRLSGDVKFEERAREIMRAIAAEAKDSPMALPHLLSAFDFASARPFGIVLSGDADSPDFREMLRTVNGRFLPHAVVLARPPGESPPITHIAAYTKSQTPIDGKATAYVCRNFACSRPATDAARLAELLDAKT